MERTPITTAAELNTLDLGEIIEGYQDGRNGEPEPGDNRSLSYWHGWRNGMVDSGRMLSTPEMFALADDVVKTGALR